jgi:hypothetical protein
MHAHTYYVEGCFGCKLRTLSFGVVPGGYRDTTSTSMFDRDAVMEQLGAADGESAFSQERIRDKQTDFDRKRREFLDA